MAIPAASVDELEILSVRLLSDHREVVRDLRRLARRLRIGLGWHYLLDLAWILARLNVRPGLVVLDAGAGQGILQWYLCERGVRVLSVDRDDRSTLPVRLRARYRVSSVANSDLQPIASAIGLEVRRDGWSPKGPLRQVRNLAEVAGRGLRGGQVTIHRADLSALEAIADGSVDAVVAVSSLEHNSPDALPGVVTELLRVLKPGAPLLATLAAARDDDWFHEPSAGWCYTEASMRRFFGLDPSISSNYAEHDRLLEELRGSSELRDNLAKFYFQSSRNGMPWGLWDPRYQPVGVCRWKRVDE